MKINVDLDDNEEKMLIDAFESAIAELFFVTEFTEEEKTDYYDRVQKLIDKFGLTIKVDDVINDLVELNKDLEDGWDAEFDIDEDSN